MSSSTLRHSARGRFAAPGRLRALAVAAATAAAGLAAVGPGAAPAPAASAACPWVGSTAPIAQRVSQLMAQMTLSQEISLMTGASGSYVGNIPAIGSLCIPALNLEDGPAGVGDGMGSVTQLPAPVDLAATWDTAAAQQYGQVIGAEQAAKGTNVDLGPTINIVRDPRWGRAFESLSEDPYLAGQLGAADIRGIQSTGTMAQVKHFAVYNQETNRNSSNDNAVVSTQAEQEIYLPAFQAATMQGVASSVMCSYAWINGTAACQNPYTLSTVLRQQFGYTGFVTSDWGATHSTAASANAGLDMDMPGNDNYYGSTLQSAVTGGQVSQATINTAVTEILTQMFAFGMFDKTPSGSPSQGATNAADQSAATGLSEEGTVLLKNSSSVLPLTSGDSSVAVIGADASTNVQSDGGGSAAVSSSGTVTPLQGIQAAAPSGVSVTYNDGSSDSSAASAAAAAKVAVVFVSDFESEGSDLTSIDLGSADDSLISAVAAANPNTVVVLNTGSAVTMPWLSSVRGVLEAWYPGQEDGTAIASVLFGNSNPSGHLTVTFPTSLSAMPTSSAAQFPGQNGNVNYSEGIDVGYRWYDQNNVTPLFPFGYGLSYTTFSYSNLHVSTLPQGGDATVTATVANTGSRAGADVAQLYVTDPAASGQPPRQLEGFQRVNLAAGASTTVTFQLSQQNLQYWNSSSNGWSTSTGNYGIEVGDGDSTATLPLSGTLSVASSQLGAPVTITSPGPQEGIVGTAQSVTVTAADSTAGQTPTFTATGLPSGVSISSTGTISGTPSTTGTSTVTVTAQDANGAQASTSFVWTVAPGGNPVAGGPPTMSVVSLKAHANGDYVDAANSTTSLIANATSIGTPETFDLLTNSDGSVSLRAHSDGDYVTAENAGASPLIANRTTASTWETFDLINNADGSISFRAHANGDIVTADNAGASPLIANRTAIGAWEEFDLVRDTVPVSFRAHANNDIVTADNAGASPLIANRTAIGTWETFDLISNSDGSVSLRAHANNDIVTADNAGASPLIANRTSIGQWEEFDLIQNADGSISFRAHANGDIVTADNAGASPLIANRTAISTWEEFDLIYD